MQSQFICHADSCASGNTFHKNSTIVELPNGDLMAAWFAGAHGEGHRDQNIYGSRRPAGADSWGDSEALVEVPGRSLGCPVLFVGPEDELWLTAPQMYGNWIISSRLLFKRSLDNGQTWGDLEILQETPSLYLKNKPLHLEEEDRWVLGVDIFHNAENKNEKPGFLLIPGDYPDRPDCFPPLVGGDQIVPQDPEGYLGDITAAPSDRDDDWTTEVPGFIYPTAVELSDGDLLAYMRPRPGGYLWETRSHDRGLNWTEARRTNIPNPNAGFDLLRTEAGNLLLVNNPTIAAEPPDGRNRLALFMSEDEGDTWPYQLYLEREKTEGPLRDIPDGERPEFTYGNLIQTTDGMIHVVYEHRRRGIKHVELSEEEIREQGTEETIVEEMAAGSD